jgi:hypothetical protein
MAVPSCDAGPLRASGEESARRYPGPGWISEFLSRSIMEKFMVDRTGRTAKIT